MGKDYEILEEQYQKLVADKAAAEGRDDLSDEERANTVAGFDKAISSLEESIIGLANKAKDEIMAAIKDIEDKMKTNEEFKEKAEKRKAELQAEIEAEEAKGEAGDKDKIRIYRAEIDGIDRDLKKIPSERTMKRKITEQKKKLLPLMNLFKEKGVFTQEEIDDLEKLEKRINRAKKKKDEPVVPGGDGTTEPGGTGTTEPGGTGTTEPGGTGTTEPGGTGTTEPGGTGTTEPGGTGTTEPGGTGTTEPGGTGTAVPGGTGTTEPGGTGTAVPGGIGTTEPGGTGTTDTPAAPTDPRDMTYAEFEEIYRAAKQRCLGVKDMEKLKVIMADPTCYEKFGISTGLFRNKAKVILVAMGSEMTRKYPEALKAVHDTYGIDAKAETGDNIVPSSEVRSWGGIKGMLGNKAAKTKGQSVFEKVIEAADAKLARGEDLTTDELALRDRAAKELETMASFRTALDTYSEVKKTRSRNPLSWFTGLGRSLSLPESSSMDTSVEDRVRADVERAGREATAGMDETTRNAMIVAALASESEPKHKKGGPEAPTEVAPEVHTTDMSATLAAGVYPPEDIDTSVGEKPGAETVEIDTFDGPGIDG